MTTLFCDGVRKVLKGHTTLEEVYRSAKRSEQDAFAIEIVFKEIREGKGVIAAG